MQFQPRNYLGTGHETIGSDILAVLATLHAPEAVLGKAWIARLAHIEPTGWYPIATLLELLDFLGQRTGRASLVKMGREIFMASHAARVGPGATCAGDVVFGIDGMYHHANRGEGIGGWEVVSFRPGAAILDKTTPHHCALEEGILHQALHAVAADAMIVQSTCLRQGDDCCRFELRSAVRDQHWMGGYAIKS